MRMPAGVCPGPAAHAAAGDCEQVRPGLIGQPVNTITSMAYVIAATWVHQRASRWRIPWVAALTWLGVGSIAYHGPGTRAGKALHDSAIVALALTIAGDCVARGGPAGRQSLVPAVIGGTAVAVHGATRTRSRACRPTSVWQGHGLWHVLSATALAAWASQDGRR
jgi:hypothetical protein